MAILSNVVGLDIGSHSLKAVEFRQTLRGFEDYELPNIEVTDEETNQQWMAGGNFDWMQDPPKPGESQVDSYTNDGSTASGTATFIDIRALTISGFSQSDRPEPVKGTFELHCAS